VPQHDGQGSAVQLEQAVEAAFDGTVQRPCCSPSWPGFNRRADIIGVSVSDTNADTKIDTAIVTANSLNRLPKMPPKNRNGTNTATKEIVIETIVKPISLVASSAACIGVFPSSM
jgi:hypothetical protein